MGYRCMSLLSIFVLIRVETVPPEACFANFRWDDCGKSPVPVMYYWKPGSRCEVGLWRGCLPNLNMFPDEYECVTTCIFTARAMPEDYHSMNENEIPIQDTTESPIEIVTDGGATVESTTIHDTTVGVGDSGGGASATTVDSKTDGTGGAGTAATTVVSKADGGGENATVATTAASKGDGGGGNVTAATTVVSSVDGGGGGGNATVHSENATTVSAGGTAAATTAAAA